MTQLFPVLNSYDCLLCKDSEVVITKVITTFVLVFSVLFFQKELKQMLFKEQNCVKCGKSYDSVLSACPSCGEHNINRKDHAIGKGYIAMPWVYQIACVILGIVVLFSLAFVSLEILKNFTDQTNALVLSDFIMYFLVFCGFVPIIAINGKAILGRFTKIKPYLIGIGIGVSIIIFSIVNTSIISLFGIENTTNKNEVTSRFIIDTYPIMSLIVLGIIGPIVEELTYRLGLFSFLNRINRILAYFVSILVFAFMHLDFSSDTNILVEFLNLPSYLYAAFAFTFAYDKFSLPCSMTAHITNNLFAVVTEIIYSSFGA